MLKSYREEYIRKYGAINWLGFNDLFQESISQQPLLEKVDIPIMISFASSTNINYALTQKYQPLILTTLGKILTPQDTKEICNKKAILLRNSLYVIENANQVKSNVVYKNEQSRINIYIEQISRDFPPISEENLCNLWDLIFKNHSLNSMFYNIFTQIPNNDILAILAFKVVNCAESFTKNNFDYLEEKHQGFVLELIQERLIATLNDYF